MIQPISAFNDNYIWMFADKSSSQAWVVDPGDAQPVIKQLEQSHLQLAGILITHHHWDHSGGVDELLMRWKHIPVYGSVHSPITLISHGVKEGDEIDCGPLRLKIFEIPGHTLDHIAFYNDAVLFSGDTLFSVGCGRVFEGTPEQMYQSLNKILKLNEETQIYCGHEYTLANLKFAQHVEPNNSLIADKIRVVTKLREEKKPTLPALLKEEKQVNPFLRCEEPSVVEAVGKHAGKKLTNPIEVFANLREWKNNF